MGAADCQFPSCWPVKFLYSCVMNERCKTEETGTRGFYLVDGGLCTKRMAEHVKDSAAKDDSDETEFRKMRSTCQLMERN